MFQITLQVRPICDCMHMVPWTIQGYIDSVCVYLPPNVGALIIDSGNFDKDHTILWPIYVFGFHLQM